MSTPAERLANRAWRRKHSKWLLGPALGAGTVTAFSLLYAGRKLHDTVITRVALALLVPTAFVWAVLLTSDTEPGAVQRPIDDVATGVMAVLWIAGGIYSVMLNRRLLRHHAAAVDVPWYGQTQADPAGLAPSLGGAHPNAWTGTLGLDQVQQAAFSAPPPSTMAQPLAAEGDFSQGHSVSADFGRPVDVNAAREDELRALPGVGPALAKRIIAHRQVHGGLRSPEDLAAAGVPPHVLAGILSAVTFTQASTPSPRGRVLDL